MSFEVSDEVLIWERFWKKNEVSALLQKVFYLSKYKLIISLFCSGCLFASCVQTRNKIILRSKINLRSKIILRDKIILHI